jgi:hypothetical protein
MQTDIKNKDSTLSKNISTQLSDFMSGKGTYICVMRRSIINSSDISYCYIVKNILMAQKDNYITHIKSVFGTDIDASNFLICVIKAKNINQKMAILKDVARYKLTDVKLSNREMADMLKISLRSYTTLIKSAKKMFGTISVWQNKDYSVVEDTEFYAGVPLIKTKQLDSFGEFAVENNPEIFIDDEKETEFEIFIDNDIDEDIFIDGETNKDDQQISSVINNIKMNNQPQTEIGSEIKIEQPQQLQTEENIFNDLQIVLYKPLNLSRYFHNLYQKNIGCELDNDPTSLNTSNGLNETDGSNESNGSNGSNETDGSNESNGLNETDESNGSNGSNETDGSNESNGLNETDESNGSNETDGLNKSSNTTHYDNEKNLSKIDVSTERSLLTNINCINITETPSKESSDIKNLNKHNKLIKKINTHSIQTKDGKRLEIIGVSKREIVDERGCPKITTIILQRNPKFKIHTYKK